MRFSDLVKYQNNFNVVMNRAKHDLNFYKQIWSSPVKTLTEVGICELDIVDFLRELQKDNPALESGWGKLYYPTH